MLVTRATACLFTHLLSLFIGYLLAKEFQSKQDQRLLLMTYKNFENRAPCYKIKIPCQEKGDECSTDKVERKHKDLCFYICASKDITFLFIHICGDLPQSTDEWDKELYFIRKKKYFKINETSCKNELITPSLLEKDFSQLRTFIRHKVPFPLIIRRNDILRALLKEFYRFQKRSIDNRKISTICFKIENDTFIVSSSTTSLSHFFTNCCCYKKVKKSNYLKKNVFSVNSNKHLNPVLNGKLSTIVETLKKKSRFLNRKQFIDEDVLHKYSIDKNPANFLNNKITHTKDKNLGKYETLFKEYLEINDFQNKEENPSRNHFWTSTNWDQRKYLDLNPSINKANVVRNDYYQVISLNYRKNVPMLKSYSTNLSLERKNLLLLRIPDKKFAFSIKNVNGFTPNNLRNTMNLNSKSFVSPSVKVDEKSSASTKTRVDKNFDFSSNAGNQNEPKGSSSYTKYITGDEFNPKRVIFQSKYRDKLLNKNYFLKKKNSSWVDWFGMKPSKRTSNVNKNSVPKRLFQKKEKIPSFDRYFQLTSKLVEGGVDSKKFKILNEYHNFNKRKIFSSLSQKAGNRISSNNKRDIINSDISKNKLSERNVFSTARKMQSLKAANKILSLNNIKNLNDGITVKSRNESQFSTKFITQKLSKTTDSNRSPTTNFPLTPILRETPEKNSVIFLPKRSYLVNKAEMSPSTSQSFLNSNKTGEATSNSEKPHSTSKNINTFESNFLSTKSYPNFFTENNTEISNFLTPVKNNGNATDFLVNVNLDIKTIKENKENDEIRNYTTLINIAVREANHTDNLINFTENVNHISSPKVDNQVTKLDNTIKAKPEVTENIKEKSQVLSKSSQSLQDLDNEENGTPKNRILVEYVPDGMLDEKDRKNYTLNKDSGTKLNKMKITSFSSSTDINVLQKKNQVIPVDNISLFIHDDSSSDIKNTRPFEVSTFMNGLTSEFKKDKSFSRGNGEQTQMNTDTDTSNNKSLINIDRDVLSYKDRESSNEVEELKNTFSKENVLLANANSEISDSPINFIFEITDTTTPKYEATKDVQKNSQLFTESIQSTQDLDLDDGKMFKNEFVVKHTTKDFSVKNDNKVYNLDESLTSMTDKTQTVISTFFSPSDNAENLKRNHVILVDDNNSPDTESSYFVDEISNSFLDELTAESQTEKSVSIGNDMQTQYNKDIDTSDDILIRTDRDLSLKDSSLSDNVKDFESTFSVDNEMQTDTENSYFDDEISNSFVNDLTAQSLTEKSLFLGNDIQTQYNKDIDTASDDILIRTDRDLFSEDGSLSVNVKSFKNTFSVDNEVQTNTKPDISEYSMYHDFKVPTSENSFPSKGREESTFINEGIDSVMHLRPFDGHTVSELSVADGIAVSTNYQDNYSNKKVLFLTENSNDFSKSKNEMTQSVISETNQDLFPTVKKSNYGNDNEYPFSDSSRKEGYKTNQNNEHNKIENDFFYNNEDLVSSTIKDKLSLDDFSLDESLDMDYMNDTTTDNNEKYTIDRRILSSSEIYKLFSSGRSVSENEIMNTENLNNNPINEIFRTEREITFLGEEEKKLPHQFSSDENIVTEHMNKVNTVPNENFLTEDILLSSTDNKQFPSDIFLSESNKKVSQDQEFTETMNFNSLSNNLQSRDNKFNTLPLKDTVFSENGMTDQFTEMISDSSFTKQILSTEARKLSSAVTSIENNNVKDLKDEINEPEVHHSRTKSPIMLPIEDNQVSSNDAFFNKKAERDQEESTEPFNIGISNEWQKTSYSKITDIPTAIILAKNKSHTTLDIVTTGQSNENTFSEPSAQIFTEQDIPLGVNLKTNQKEKPVDVTESTDEFIYTEQKNRATSQQKIPTSDNYTTAKRFLTNLEGATESINKTFDTEQKIQISTKNIISFSVDISTERNKVKDKEETFTEKASISTSNEWTFSSTADVRKIVSVEDNAEVTSEKVQADEVIDLKIIGTESQNVASPGNQLTSTAVSSKRDDPGNEQIREVTEIEGLNASSADDKLTSLSFATEEDVTDDKNADTTFPINEIIRTERQAHPYSQDSLDSSNNPTENNISVTKNYLFPKTLSKNSNLPSKSDLDSELREISTKTTFDSFATKDVTDDNNGDTIFTLNELTRTERQVHSSSQDSLDSSNNPTENNNAVTKNDQLPSTLNNNLNFPSGSDLDSELREISTEATFDSDATEKTIVTNDHNVDTTFPINELTRTERQVHVSSQDSLDSPNNPTEDDSAITKDDQLPSTLNDNSNLPNDLDSDLRDIPTETTFDSVANAEAAVTGDHNGDTTFPINELTRTERQVHLSSEDSLDSPNNPTENDNAVTKNDQLPSTLNNNFNLPRKSELDYELPEISTKIASDSSVSESVERSTKSDTNVTLENKNPLSDISSKSTTMVETSFDVDKQKDFSKTLKPYTNQESSTTQSPITKINAGYTGLRTTQKETSIFQKTLISSVTSSMDMDVTSDKTTFESMRERDVLKSTATASSAVSFTESMESSRKVTTLTSRQSIESSTKEISSSHSPSFTTTIFRTTSSTTMKPSTTTNNFISSVNKKSSITTTFIPPSDYTPIPFHFTIDADYDIVVGKRKKEFEEDLTKQLVVAMRIPLGCIQKLQVSKGSIEVNFDLVPNSKYGHMADEKALKAAADELKRRIDNGQLNIKDLNGNTLVVVPMDPPTKAPVVNKTEHTTIILAVVIGAFILTVISVAIAAIIIKRKANGVHRLTPIEEVRSKLPSYREIPFQEALFMRGPTKNKLMLGKYCYNTGKWLGPGPEPIPYQPPDSVVYRPPTDSEIRQTPRPSTAVRERLRNDWELDWDSMVFSR